MRDEKCDFWEGILWNALWIWICSETIFQFRTHKVIYRRYAGLFFSVCVDITDNELAYLESIHLFVEILDHFFSNVCELDLVFNFHKVPNLFLSYFCSLGIVFVSNTMLNRYLYAVLKTIRNLSIYVDDIVFLDLICVYTINNCY